MIESFVTTVSFLSLVYGLLAFCMWRASKRPCPQARKRDEDRDWYQRMARSLEEERKRDLQRAQRQNAEWDRAMRKLRVAIEDADSYTGPF